ncbi:MAG: phenylalanine--tRNA ligase subunit beta [Acidimicrobiaceae bacterium]|nr:phenylalanine--tRNA ligase subunit beta [Acidimicrobiaceae bacterium]
MKVLLSWLSEFADFERADPSLSSGAPTEELISKLVDGMNNLGLVVEGVEWVGRDLDDVYVAKVLEVDAIPKADKIRRVLADVGALGEIQVVCGAFNFGVGDFVPYAAIGAKLPNGVEIRAAKMRGTDSFGMLCSPTELKLGAESGGLMLLDQSLKPGEKLADALGIVPDVLFDLAIEANRPDANSVIGVARDLAAWFDLEFRAPAARPHGQDLHKDAALELSVIEDPSICDRFLLATFSNMSSCKVASFVGTRLELCGMRSINPVVDASNYVMLELGQPTHPYDRSRLDGGVVSVRRARVAEALVTLDGTVRTLGVGDSVTDVVITDGSDSPVGLAGIMGGESSEISSDTDSVLLELAHFDSKTIARSSKRLQLRSEASARFERGVDPELPRLALQRFAELLGVEPDSVYEATPYNHAETEILVRPARLALYLGRDFSAGEISNLISPIGFKVEERDGIFLVTVPSFRPDCSIEEDVIEEIARHFGYANIERRYLTSPKVGRLTTEQRSRRSIRAFGRDAGYFEAWGPSMVGPGEHSPFGITGEGVELDNPLAVEESVLRRSLLPGLVRALSFNAGRRISPVRLFEFGKVFEPGVTDEGLPFESERVGFLATDAEDASLEVVHTLRRLVALLRVGPALFDTPDHHSVGESVMAWPKLHPTRSNSVFIGGRLVGVIGELDPDTVTVLTAGNVKDRVGYFELDLDEIFALEPKSDSATPVTSFPSSDVDMAFLVDYQYDAQTVADAIMASVGDLCESVTLFDSYSSAALGDGIRSLAFTVRLSSLSKTLTDAEIQQVISIVSEDLNHRFGATLRSA